MSLKECVDDMVCSECGTELDNFDNDCKCPCHGMV